MAQHSTPKYIILEMTYRNISNFRRTETFKLSNDKGITADVIREAFDEIGESDIVPMQWSLPTLSPLSHPDEPTNDLDHCYMEISSIEYFYDGEHGHFDNTHEDVSDVVEAVKNGGCKEYKQFDASLKEEQIESAKKLLLSKGYAITSPDKEVCVILKDESNDETVTATINTTGNLGIAISLSGYGDYYSQEDNGSPIYIDKYEGDIRVVIYGDINNEDATHKVSLKDAKLSNRI